MRDGFPWAVLAPSVNAKVAISECKAVHVQRLARTGKLLVDCFVMI